MKYAIVLEPTDSGYSAWCPDLPGCISTGATRDEVRQKMQEAISLHLEGLRDEGLQVPDPISEVETLDVPN